jgi:hypothetical protein
MLITGNEPTERYEDYKNRVMAKHLFKIKNQLQQIKSCSLRQEHKEALKKQIVELFKQ